jgi:hypothetical protein
MINTSRGDRLANYDIMILYAQSRCLKAFVAIWYEMVVTFQRSSSYKLEVTSLLITCKYEHSTYSSGGSADRQSFYYGFAFQGWWNSEFLVTGDKIRDGTGGDNDWRLAFRFVLLAMARQMFLLYHRVIEIITQTTGTINPS